MLATHKGGLEACPSDFRPSEIVSDAFSEYTARIPRIMQTAPRNKT